MKKIITTFKLSVFTSLILLSHHSFSDDYFDPSLLDGTLGIDPNEIDLSQFSKKDAIPEGKINLTVYVNRNSSGEYLINLVKDKNHQVVPEVTPSLLEQLGVKVSVIPGLSNLKQDEVIDDIKQYIPDASIIVDISNLKLNVSFPQSIMSSEGNGYLDPSLFNSGVTAMFVNYMLSGSHTSNDSIDSNSGKHENNNFFAQLRGGFNFDEWRLRSIMTYTYTQSKNSDNKQSHNKSDFSNTYLSRNLYDLRSEFIVGETTSGSEVFDSIPMRGLRLISNQQMLPASQQGFAPDVSGIAQSNAKITIRQNGYVIYQTYVAPGPFKITDLYASGSGGNLDVTITEENGSERTFIVAFSSLPVMLRPGGWKYEMVAGRYNGGTTIGSKEADFALASGIYGLPRDITLYGGLIGARNYVSIVSGVGVSLGRFGALSADVTHANAVLGSMGSQSGQSYRIRYSKNMMSTGTSVDLTALRYSTENYYDFSQFNTSNYRLKDDQSPWINERERGRFTTSISQSLGDYGSVYLSGSRYDYWSQDKSVTQLVTGYNGNYQGINFGINYSIDRVITKESWPKNRQVSINISIPFSLFSRHPLASNISSTYMFSRDNQGRINQQAGLSGSALDSSLSYGISQGWANKGQSNSGSLYGNYSSNYGTTSAGYNYSKDYYSVNGNMNGGLLVHSGGLLFGRTLGDSMAIIEADGANGAVLNSGDGKINASGYGLAPYLTEYRQNTIGLNVNTLPEDVTLDSTSQNVIPTKGAIVKIKFKTRIGHQVIFNLIDVNNKSVPFGATATLTDSEIDINTGLVGEGGQLYMSGLPDSGKILVKWGNGNKQSCYVTYPELTKIKTNEEQPIRTLSLPCN